jgi:hypothetical protein
MWTSPSLLCQKSPSAQQLTGQRFGRKWKIEIAEKLTRNTFPCPCESPLRRFPLGFWIVVPFYFSIFAQSSYLYQYFNDFMYSSRGFQTD